MASTMLEREMKRGSAELLILALLEERERHGYDIGKQIEERSDALIKFHINHIQRRSMWPIGNSTANTNVLWSLALVQLRQHSPFPFHVAYAT